MQELSNAKLSSAYLNGIKDSLNSGGQAGGSEAIQDLLRAASLLGGFGFGGNPLSSLSQNAGAQPSGNSKSSNSHPNKSTNADSGSSKMECNPASRNNEQPRSKRTPTPENGQARSSESHRGNGKSTTHDDTPASDDSGELALFVEIKKK